MAQWRIRTQWRDGHKCNHMSDEPCERCDAAKARPFATPYVFSWNNPTFEHMFDITETPRPMESREELRRECLARGVRSQLLEESTIFRDREDRWI